MWHPSADTRAARATGSGRLTTDAHRCVTAADETIELLEHHAPLTGLEDLCRDDPEIAAALGDAADGLHGASVALRRIRGWVERVAVADATVLITGESGTGKELVARAIHARSSRREQPFVGLNCAAIPEPLIESELFGHVRGAFTGAIADRAGCFRISDGGSLFLDEIADLPVHVQAKLLRVLQERVVRPIGGDIPVAVDVRIIAASNRDLDAAVKAGRLRDDLYYRLNVLSITLPALRARRDDIPLLVRHFLRRFSSRHDRRVMRFSVNAAKRLLQYDYPGNIRELENIVEHAVALCDGETVAEEHLPAYLFDRARPARHPMSAYAAVPGTNGCRSYPAPSSPSNGVIDLERDLAAYEKAALVHALCQARGVKKRAAELLGINYRSLRHRLHKYGLDGHETRSLNRECAQTN